ncbi:carbohydrate ABC transporter permease [Mesorhizobium sp. VK9D]|uniref:carbohydrate ABC transporter permease n=1 Tax=Mesorhizobium australafricanum TaxID=3072311 RepID=UPI002A2460BB|nr:carbohydrate ABC transporter permease [Mesorhizobium sp. VK9D]MDX8454259.1 carbohydrate ABC transporter permease [Mesorhizobium sp. VK9D]
MIEGMPISKIARRLAWLWLLIIIAFFMVPIAYLLATSFKTPDDVLQGYLLPGNTTLENYPAAFRHVPIASMIRNSTLIAVLSGIITLVITVPATYAMVKLGFLRRVIPNITLASYAAPPIIALVPLFFLMQMIGLIDTIPGLALVYGIMNIPVAFWLLRSFVKDIPDDIDEAAWVDGAGYWLTLRRIVLPLLWPGIIATALICIILSYNELLFASAMTFKDTSRTITVGMSLFQGERLVNFGQMAAGSFAGMLPVYVIAVFFQRYLVGGLTQGSVK